MVHHLLWGLWSRSRPDANPSLRQQRTRKLMQQFERSPNDGTEHDPTQNTPIDC